MITNLPISVCMIVKNEEAYIAKCIRSLKSVVNEINVVDTGSTDQTIAIAVEEGVRVHHYPWNDNFSDARNYAISVATQPYILIMDADEILDQTTAEFLEQYTNCLSDVPATVIVRSVLDEQRIVNSRLTRLFPNCVEYQYKGIIHEQLTYKGTPIEAVQNTNIVINHTGYQDSEIQKKNKIDRNLRLLRKQQESDSNSCYISFQIGQTLYVNGDYEQAIPAFDEALQSASKQGFLPDFISTLFLSYGYCLLNTAQFDILDNLINDAIEFYPDFTDLYFLYGVSLIDRKDVQKFTDIKGIFEYCLHLGEVTNPSYESVEGVGSYRALFNLGVYFEVTDNDEEAYRCYSKSAEYQFKPALVKLQTHKEKA
ncbi:glycosyltransferase family 2 protein [Paenibacillus lautus]|uniref:glycosyltransferase family 2 protein n=1 Tax=Paenibacillus lautus TaxID=1401 RepID=UPI001C1274A4|nr:glycosyltransferase family 2 protein [Paenibacillus lautus]MBU5349295.1 glycosyltransferase family 2 protein [Paenibacillus lautus]